MTCRQKKPQISRAYNIFLFLTIHGVNFLESERDCVLNCNTVFLNAEKLYNKKRA